MKKRRNHARIVLLEPVAHVVRMLGVQGRFSTSSGTTAFIGDPDYLWFMDKDRPHPKLIVCASTALSVCTVIEFHLCRLSTRLGGRLIWWICLQSMDVHIMTLSAENPWQLSNRSMDI